MDSLGWVIVYPIYPIFKTIEPLRCRLSKNSFTPWLPFEADFGYISDVRPPSIFSYFDYRKYLADYYQYRKEKDKYFSFRYFAGKAKLKSASVYPNILAGKKNLTASLAPRFAAEMDLTANERHYLDLLIEFTHAKSDKLRRAILERMIPYLPSKTKRLTENHRDFYYHWYNIAIHQSLMVLDIGDGNFSDLVEYIYPRIGLNQVNKSMRLLKDLDLIGLDRRGFYKPKQKDLVGGKEIGPLYIQQFQKDMLDIGKSAMEDPGILEKYFVTESFSVSGECKRSIFEKAREFHKQIIQLILSDDNPEEEVFQLNLQLHPLYLTKKRA